MLRRLLLLVITFLAISCYSQYYDNQTTYNISAMPKREVRAVWLTTLGNLDWPKTFATSEYGVERQKRELIYMLNQYQKANINTVLLQTRVRAATIYPSNIEPWDECITGKAGQAPPYGYDPLKFAVEECHKRGMEIHAWIAAVPVGASKSLGCRQMKSKGFDIRGFSSGSYVNPSDPKIAEYLADICTEITRNYDIDGINLDYIRYPDGWRSPTYRNGDTPNNRRENITRIVKAVHDKVKAIKPWVKISCSPIGKYSDLSRYSSKNYNARDRVSQEAQAWVKAGIMDQLYPMQYFLGNNYYPYCADWMENSNNKDIISGLGTYFLDPREGKWTLSDISRQMYVSRSLGMGHAHFRSSFLLNNREGIFSFEKYFNAYPALTPAMTWQSKSLPNVPILKKDIDFITYTTNNDAIINWQGNTPYYNIYIDTNYPVDITNSRNLVISRYDGTSFRHSNAHVKKIYYAITAMDRFGNESAPLQATAKPSEKKKLLDNNGAELELPNECQENDFKYYTIESLEGVVLRKIFADYSNARTIGIYMLPQGVYSIRGHKSKHKTGSRIGFFAIKK